MPFQFDTALLKTFIAVAETGSFSQAAQTVGRTQSAVSLQIKKLEEGLRCGLFDRGTRHVSLTDKGEIFLSYARRMVELQWETYSRLNEPEVKGEIRLGTPEDFATHYLPNVLATFAKHHPQVQLNVQCDLTLNLLQGFKKGAFDVVLVKRDPARVKGGTRIWREPLVWVGLDSAQIKTPLSLVLSPQPCIYRARALAALDRARKPWQISYTSPSLAGTLAAVRAGLGITVLPAQMIPTGLIPLRAGPGRLPHLSDAEIAMIRQDRLSPAARALADHLVAALEQPRNL